MTVSALSSTDAELAATNAHDVVSGIVGARLMMTTSVCTARKQTRLKMRNELRMESEVQVLVAALIIAVIYILWKKGEDDGEQ